MGQELNFVRSIQRTLTPEDQLEFELDDELPNEFGDNSTIIYGSFRHRLPLGELSNLIGDGSVPEAVTRRLLRFYSLVHIMRKPIPRTFVKCPRDVHRTA